MKPYKPSLIMTVGLVGAVTSYWAEKYAEENNCLLISFDSLREQLFNDVNNQDNNNELFKTIYEIVKNSLKCKCSIIVDATNINYKKRMNLLDYIKDVTCVKKCVIIARPYEDCLKMNAERERKVPEEVIRRMYENFNVPQYWEGWDEIEIVYPNPDDEMKYGSARNVPEKYADFDQENHHHLLTLGNHIKRSYVYLVNNSYNKVVCEAALLHDVGKPFTKSKTNSKGEPTDEAHYYNHHNVGAYDTLFYYCEQDKLTVAGIVNYHMQPYFWTQEKTANKYAKLWGQEFYGYIMAMHKADELAH